MQKRQRLLTGRQGFRTHDQRSPVESKKVICTIPKGIKLNADSQASFLIKHHQPPQSQIINEYIKFDFTKMFEENNKMTFDPKKKFEEFKTKELMTKMKDNQSDYKRLLMGTEDMNQLKLMTKAKTKLKSEKKMQSANTTMRCI